MKPRWFAVLYLEARFGYALDYYPEEKRDYLAEAGENIIGDFATYEKATAAIVRALEKMK